MLKVFKKISSNIFVRIGFLILFVLTVVNFFHSRFLFVEAFDSEMKIFPGAFILEEGGSEKLPWQNINESFFQDLSEESDFSCFSIDNSAYIISRASFDDLLNNKRVCHQSAVESFELIDVSGKSSNLSNENEQDVATSTEDGNDSDVIDSENDSNEDDSNEDDSTVSSDAIIVDNFSQDDEEEDDSSEGNIFDVGEMADDDLDTSSQTVVDELEQMDEEFESEIGSDDDNVQKEEDVLPEDTSGQIQGVSEEAQNISEPEVEVSPAPSPDPVLIPEPSSAPDPVSPTDVSFNAKIKEKFSSFLSYVKNISDVRHLEVFAQDATSSTEFVATSTEGSASSTNGIAVFKTEDSNSDSLKQALLFSDFSVPFIEGENKIGGLNLNLSLAASSSLSELKILIQKRIGDESWRQIGQIEVNKEISNSNNKGYYIFEVEGVDDWPDVDNLELRVSVENKNKLNENDKFELYLDALWLEVEYAEQQEEEEDTEEKEFELDTLSLTENFLVGENPQFEFELKKNRNFLARFGMSILSLVSDEFAGARIRAKLENRSETGISEVEIPLTVKYISDGRFKLEFGDLPEDFKPGKYTVEIVIEDASINGGIPLSFSQNFTWGVLAINTNKSVYLSTETEKYPQGERAYLQMAVLDDFGHTICDARLTLEITSPFGQVTVLSTDNGEIIMNEECGPDNIIDSPDYYAFYQTDMMGSYLMRLTAQTDNGEREIVDEFYVFDALPFEIERVGPTRIYPWVGYSMEFYVVANEDYKGEFIETVPVSFEIPEREDSIMRELENVKEIVWEVDWKKGESYKYRYVFDAPDVSPEFYLLGKARTDNFEERRRWQIASDAEVNYVVAESIAYSAGITDTVTWTEVVKADASSFTGGDKYFVYVSSGISKENNNTGLGDFEIRYGSNVEYTGAIEPYRSAAHDAYQVAWFDVFEQPSTPVDVTFNLRSGDGSTFHSLNSQIYAINLSNLEESDWEYASSTLSHTHQAAGFNKMASTTLSDADGVKDWLVFAMEEMDINVNNRNFFGRLYDDSGSYMSYSREGENVNELLPYVLFRPFDDVVQNTTFGLEVSNEVVDSNDHLKSRIFALNLDVFQSHKTYYADTNTSVGTSWTAIGNLNSGGNYTPNSTGDQFIMTSWICDTGGTAEMDDQVLVNGSVSPSAWTWTNNPTGKQSYDTQDEIFGNIMSKENIPSTGYTINLEAAGDSVSRIADEISMTVFSTNLNVQMNITVDSQRRSDDVSIANGDWSNDSDMKFVAGASGGAEAQMNFYYEIVDVASSTTSATAEPSNACASGTVFDSCTSKIWQIPVSATSTWYDLNYAYRKKIIINASQVVSEETDFPVLSTTTDADFAHTDNGGHSASSTGGDFVVTDSDGITLLNFERDSYSSTTGAIALWIKTDISSTTNKDLYIYYGNSSTTMPDLSTTTGVWDSEFVGVYHFGNDSFDDSSIYSNNGLLTDTNSSSDGSAVGTIGGALELSDGAVNQADYVTISSVADQFSGADFTLSAWINIPGGVFVDGASPEEFGTLFGINDSSGGNKLIASINDGTAANEADNRFGPYDGAWRTSEYTTTVVADDDWHYVTYIRNSGTDYIYADSNQEGSTASNFVLASNDRWSIGTEYDGASASDWLTGFIDEVHISNVARTNDWIETEFNNQLDSSTFITYDTEESLSAMSFTGVVEVTSIPDSSDGYKWQVIVFDSEGGRSAWRKFNSVTPNFKVDSTAPQAPGPLDDTVVTGESVTFDYGYPAVDDFFSHYEIHYKEATAGVQLTDTEVTDTDLLNRLYNGATDITIEGLQPDKTYVFNIWAFDYAGNVATATEVSVLTTAPGRARTVKFLGGRFSGDGTTGQQSDTNNVFVPFNFSLAENNVNITNAYIIFEAQVEAYSNLAGNWTGYTLAFDACQEPCDTSAFSGFTNNDTSVLAYNGSESFQVRLLFDITNESQISSYSGSGVNMEGQIGYNFERGTAANAIANAQAIMVVTYTFDNSSESITNTITYPLQSSTASGTKMLEQSDDCVLDNNCPLFTYNVEIPEYITSPNASRLSEWFVTYNVNDSHNANDFSVDVNIEGDDTVSTTTIHESANSGTQGNTQRMFFSDVSGYAENTAQVLEYRAVCSSGGAGYSMIGGEVFETYVASSSVSEKTRTVSFPMGIINNGHTGVVTYASTQVYFPENGKESGQVEIKKAWIRLISHDSASGQNYFTVATKVGDNATTSATVYAYDVGGTVIKPSFNVVHLIPDSEYEELESANGVDFKEIIVSTQNSDSTDQGGTSAELVITYSYADESEGYLTSLSVMGGQVELDPQALTLATTTVALAPMPEADEYKTMLSAALESSFLLADNDGSVSADYLIDANMATSGPVCSNVFEAGNNTAHSFIEFYKNVTSAMTITHNESYIACYSNDQGGDVADGGAKPNSQLIYTYKYYVPRLINVSADEQYLSDGFTVISNGSWINEENVVLSASAIDTSTSTEIDFFFELIPSAQSFTATKTAPTVTCNTGTAYGSCSGMIWKDTASSSSTWYNSSWPYRKKITLNASQISSDEIDFPVLATTTDANLAYTLNGGHMASSTGADIVIVESDQTTVLEYEREYYDSTTGELVLWIKTDISSTTNKDLYIYYGNGSASDLSTTTGVWDDDFVAVYHLSESPGDGGTFYDSSAFSNDGTFTDANGNSDTSFAGNIDGAVDFNGDADYINVNSIADDISSGDFTFSAWVNIPNSYTGNAYASIFSINDSGGGNIVLTTIGTNGAGTDNEYAIYDTNAWEAFSTTQVADNSWHHISYKINGTTGYLFVDGDMEDSHTVNYTLNATHLWSIATEYDSGPVASDWLNGSIDEIQFSKIARTNEWIKTEANNQSGDNFLTFNSSEDTYSNPSITNTVSVTSIPDSAAGYKWQVLACNNLNNCAVWDTFNLPPNFKVDTIAPSAPGNLILATTTTKSITVNFGIQTDETNFSYYKIFYKTGISGVDETDTEHSDANLLAKDYNGVASTTINNLEAYTQYVINIWAYDLAGNKTSATELVVTTASADHARAGSVEFVAGVYTDETGATGLDSNTQHTFDQFTFDLAEHETEIRDAYIVFEGQILAYSNGISIDGYDLAFDACEEPCTADAWNGTGTVSMSDTSVLAYSEGSSNQIKLLLDVSNETELVSYIGDGTNLEAQVGFSFDTVDDISLIANAKAMLVVTYAYNSDESTNYTNTVYYPLNSNASGDTGSMQAKQADDCLTGNDCPLFSYNFTAPEVDTVQSQWYQIYGVNDLHGNNDVLVKVKIERTGVSSDAYLHESSNGGTQGNLPRMIFKDIYDFQENIEENLEIRASSPGGAEYYILGGEIAETYTAQTDASTKTRTVSFPMGVLDAGNSLSFSSSSVDVYFPENGEGSGIVNVESAWFRIVSNTRTSADYYLYASSSVGNTNLNDTKSYLFNTGGSIVHPMITIIHVIASTSYSELELASAIIPKAVTLFASPSDVNVGGISAELMITYTYSSESSGYMSSVKLFGGQSNTNGNTTENILPTANSVFPELRGEKTLFGATILPSFLISDSDTVMPSGLYGLDANMAQSSPSCGNLTYYTRTDSFNAYASFAQNVTSALSVTDNQSYSACYSIDNTPDTDSGAKMNAEWNYTYGWVAPPTEFTQSDWRWYENNDAVTPITSKAAEKTTINNIFVGESLRLRVNVAVTREDMGASSQTFKLQYGAGSDCTVVGTWTDVGQQGGSELWLGYNNPTPADGANLSSYLLASSTVAQSYEEENATAVNPNLVPVGGYSEWDFVLYNNYASSSDFCFRLVKGNGTELDDYLGDSYPKAGTASANTSPDDPTGLEQYKNDAVTTISNTSWINENDVRLEAAATDPNLSETITLYYEFIPSSASFRTATSEPSGACVSGTNYNVCASALSGWSFKRIITLSTSTPVDNYQVKIDLTSSNFDYAQASSTGTDIRFYDNNNVELDYWIDFWNQSGNSTVWVEVASSSTDDFTMYYGNMSATSTSNGTSTFDFFDDFNGSSLDTTKWTNVGGSYSFSNGEFVGVQGDSILYVQSNGYTIPTQAIIEFKMRTEDAAPSDWDGGIGIGNWNFIDDQGVAETMAIDTARWWGSVTDANVSRGTYIDYHDYRVVLDATTAYFYDDTDSRSHSVAGSTNGTLYLLNDGESGGGGTVIDRIFVRKYATTTPVVTVGAEGSGSIWFVNNNPAGDFRVSPWTGTTSITSIPESSGGYKWQVLACDKDGECSDWTQFDVQTPNFRVDTTPPSIPGDMSYSSSTPTSITLIFGATTTEENFSRYRIYYREGTSNVSESDLEHDDDANLLDIDFNGATTTTVIDLSAGTEYVFNIWAYDLAGNVASATNWIVGTTTSSYTQPTGLFNNVTQKTDGSGAADVIIVVDDADNDNTLSAKLFYEVGTDCFFNPASTTQLTIDISDENVSATYGDPQVDNNQEFQVGSSTGWIITAPGQNYVFVDWLSKVDVPDADTTYCLGLIVNDNVVQSENSATATRLIILDNVAPAIPGDLSISSKDFDSITLNYGSASSDRNFDKYRMFYVAGLSGVTDDASSTEHIDTNMDEVNYNSATSTEVTGLLPNTWYTFNIFAYDTKGNVASATEISVKTNAKPTNITANEQYRSDGVTAIANLGWTNEDKVMFKASAHDQDISDYITFYYELLTTAGTFTSTSVVPGNTCTSTESYVDCASKIWEVSTTTYSLPTDWYDNDWLYRKKLTINFSEVVATESSFVVLATTTDSELATGARSDGYDILFTDSSGTTTLLFEREYYNSGTGELVSWIKTDISSTTDVEIYMYYGNQLNDTDFSTTTGVWSSEYRGVWHLGETVVDESSEVGVHLDSSGNSNHGDQNSNNEVSGFIGMAQEVDGSDYISIPDDNTLDLLDAVTMDFWYKGTTVATLLTTTKTFSTAGTTTWTVPIGVTSVEVKSWGAGGAGGGGGSSGLGGAGGGGAFAQATITVVPGETLDINVGGAGTGGTGVVNGNSGSGGGAGGYSGILRTATPLIVAAGGAGGGGGDNSSATAGGAGGAGGADTGVSGGASSGSTGGTGGTLSVGGTGGTGTQTGADGSSLSGGGGSDGNDTNDGGENNGGTMNGGDGGLAEVGGNGYAAGGGGGAGYFGGGGGGDSVGGDAGGGGGGGGSSYVTGTATTTTAGSGVNAANTGDVDYIGSVGVGGSGGSTSANGSDGNDGYITITYQMAIRLVGKADAYDVQLDQAGNIYGIINDQSASTTISADWHHIVLAYDRTAGGTDEGKMYIDGVLTKTIDYATAINSNGTDLYLGSQIDGVIDEVRISDQYRNADWINTMYNNQSNVSDFITFSSEEKVVSYYESMLVLDIDETTLGSGYKWQVKACDDDGDCSNWERYNVVTPNFSVDTITPTAPGQLGEFSKTSSNIILSFGSATTELNFTEYKIYYSTSSPVTENDSLYSSSTDANLGHKDYNSASTATIDGLLPDTIYYFNIWAYDIVGHKASSTVASIATNPSISSPGAIFYTKGTRSLFYRVWDGTDWGTEQTGPTFGSAAGDNIRHIETTRSDDGGKIAVLVKTHDGSNQEWWATVYYFAADSFDTATQLGATYVSSTNAQLITSCLGTLSGKEFMVVRNNNGADGSLVYSWNSVDGWTAEATGPSPSAVMNACELVRRPGTDNFILVMHDDDNDINTTYYYGGSTYTNSWTTVTQHSAVEEDPDNFAGDAFFDPSDNTRGAISYSNSSSNNYAKVKYFVVSNNSINYGTEVDSPTVVPDNWGGDFVHGEFIVDPMSTGVAYYFGRDNTDDLNIYQIDITSAIASWATTTNGDDISGGDLYLETNDAQKPFAGIFYKEDKGLVTWIPNTNPSFPQYRLLDASANSVDSSSTAIPDSTTDRWTRVKTYTDPNEDEVLLVYQNDNVDYAAVFFEGGNNRFYNTVDHPASNQTWTVLAAATGASDIQDENFSFSYASFNSPPNSPSSIQQLKLDGSTVIANQAWTNEDTVTFKVSVTDNDTEENIKVYLELLANNDTFTASTTEPINYCATSTYFMDCNSKIWLIGSSSLNDFSVSPYVASAEIGTTSDSTIGYKWRVISCDDDNECSAWTNFNAVQPNYYVDTITPNAPGALTVTARDSDSVTLTFGAQGSDANFDEYKIFYKENSGSITESDSEWSQVDDSNLGSETYGGAGSTIVTGLSSSTVYFFNIWIYDFAGNSASATPEVSTTTASLPNIVQTSYIWENDDGSDVDSNSSATTTYEVDLENEEIGERMNLRIQIENNGGDVFASKVYELQFENQTDNPGTWVNVGAATEISYSAGLSGSNGDAITLDKANVNTNTWADGTWHEGSAETAIYSLAYNSYTEFVFALETSSALAGKTYRFRLYNQTDGNALNSYTNYASLTTISASAKRYSKENVSSLPSATTDLAYYYDPGGYEAVLTDDGTYDSLSATNYPVNFFAVKHSNNTDAITVNWNGQTNLAPSSNNVVLQVYKYGSPNEWVTIDTNLTTGANVDFDLNANLNSSLSSYYGSSNWTYFRVYQENGTETLLSDYFNVAFSAPVPTVKQLHYRWRDDDGSETTASWRELEDQGDPLTPTVNIDVDEVIRLRIEFANTGAGTASSYNFDLEYSTSTGDCSLNTYWESVAIDYSSHWNMGTSTNVSGRQVSTAQLSNSETYTFVAGSILENTFTASDNITLTENEFTEVEYVLSPTSNSITAATYCFRGNDSGSQLDSYDVYPLVTLAGNTNNAPYFSVYPSDSGSASTSVTAYGSDITFTATALDDDNDDYYLAICKTNSITAGTDAPPSCTAGDWCISSSTASSTQATCDYTAAEDTEMNDWYAFVCDKVPGFGIAKCSASSQGEGTVEDNSPFVINHPPVFSVITTVVDNQDPGSTFVIKATADDTDSYGGDDTLTLYICDTNSATWSGCDNVTLCAAASSSDPYCSINDTAPSPPSTTDYYAFVFDNHSLAAQDNSRASSYTINNVAPSLGTLVLNAGADITLNMKGAGDTAISTINSSVVDLNGCLSLVSATAVVYMSSATDGSSCSADDNDCYQIAVGNCVISDCSGASDTEATYTCSSALKYFASPTDDFGNNPNEPQNWLSYINVYDGTNYSATTSLGVELETTLALEVPEILIDFGSSMSVGEDTGNENATTTVENAGNCPIDTNLSGTDMDGNPTGTIDVDNVKWSLIGGFEYSTTGTPLTTGSTLAEINAPKATTTNDVSDDVYWGIGIPFATDRSIFTGQNSFQVVIDSDGW